MKDRLAAGRGRILVIAALMVCSAWYVSGPASDSAPPPTAGGANAGAPTPSAAPATALFDGTGSCSGRGCHGAIIPKVVKPPRVAQNEYTIWLTAGDPHEKAYRTLASDEAKQMMKILSRRGVYAKEAAAEPRCLACHSVPTPAGPAAFAWNPQGVSCDGCHGSPAKWEYDHIYWNKAAPEALKDHYQASGMTWLRDPVSRAQTCVGCHIGAPASPSWPLRDMNHDMIAAGHPRLQFDYQTFLASLPKHWQERTTGPGVATVEWAAGQLVGLESSLRLTADRANAAASGASPLRPWPEFSESQCFACHRPLRPPLGRKDAIGARASWRDLYSGPREAALSFAAKPFRELVWRGDLAGAMNALDAQFARRGDPGATRDLALEALGRLATGNKGSPALIGDHSPIVKPECFPLRELTRAELAAAEQHLDDFAATRVGADWELAVQWYFGLSVLEHTQPKRIQDALRELNDPSRFTPERFERLRKNP